MRLWIWNLNFLKLSLWQHYWIEMSRYLVEKRGLFKERLCSQGSKFLPLRVDPQWERRQNRKWQNCFSITCTFHLRTKSSHNPTECIYHIYWLQDGVFHSPQWLQKTISVLWNFAVIRVLPFLNSPKDLDLSYKMDLDFFWLFWKGKKAFL